MFDEEDALERLEAFASLNGPAFYGLPPNDDRIALVRRPTRVPDDVPVEGAPDGVRPFRSGETLGFSLGPG
jgi:dihydroorotase